MGFHDGSEQAKEGTILRKASMVLFLRRLDACHDGRSLAVRFLILESGPKGTIFQRAKLVTALRASMR
jgi:hypothetical protein